MPMIQFSEPKHVSLLCNGLKQQTTRKPREKHPIKVNDKIIAYFKPRRRKGNCSNCIKKGCDWSNFTGFKELSKDKVGCPDWINFFGETVVTSVHITDFEHMSSIDRE